MTEMILVKIAPLGREVKEIMVPAGSTVSMVLQTAAAAGINVGGHEDLRKNGKIILPTDIVMAGDIITLVPAIRGGKAEVALQYNVNKLVGSDVKAKYLFQ